ncbi:hypothetical protein V1477_002367 [Vespula maculifrons]|uniref:Uncharacterized protein n=1 Tax=Vespula maculifrons TaxID=7453 RepID=A0ABD2CWA7_VESMC
MDAAVRIIANVQTPLSIQPKGGMFEDKGEPFANLRDGDRLWKEQGRKGETCNGKKNRIRDECRSRGVPSTLFLRL